MLWLLIKLSKGGYIAEVDFEVNYSKLPKNRVFTENPPRSINLRLQGTGFSLLKYAWFNSHRLNIDLSKLKRKSNGSYYWLSNSERSELENQINTEETRLLSIRPDSLFFRLSTLVKRTLPVELMLKPQFDTTKYTLYKKPLIEPAKVTVWGPAESLKDLDHISTEMLIISEVEDSLETKLDLMAPDIEYLKLDRESVKVQLQFSPLTEGTIRIPILALNVPDSLEMELFPSEIEIQYSCALQDFKSIRADEFFIYADYQEIATKQNAQFISLRYEQPPSQVRDLHLRTKRVEFILSKK